MFTKMAFFISVSEPVYRCLDRVYFEDGSSKKLLSEVRWWDVYFLSRSVSMIIGL